MGLDHFLNEIICRLLHQLFLFIANYFLLLLFMLIFFIIIITAAAEISPRFGDYLLGRLLRGLEQRGWGSCFQPDWKELIDQDPRMVAATEDSMYVFIG
jgi:hypothetical protein